MKSMKTFVIHVIAKCDMRHFRELFMHFRIAKLLGGHVGLKHIYFHLFIAFHYNMQILGLEGKLIADLVFLLVAMFPHDMKYLSPISQL